jgi:hypothetical protein
MRKSRYGCSDRGRRKIFRFSGRLGGDADPFLVEQLRPESAGTCMCDGPAGFLQRGSQLRGDPVAHKPELRCKAQRQRRRRDLNQVS